MQAFEIKVPKLAVAALTALAFEHWNTKLKSDGEPEAETIVKELASNGSGKRRQEKDWIAARCVEYLRIRIAEQNSPLVVLASKTKVTRRA